MFRDSGCQLFGAYRCAIGIKDAAILVHSTVGCNWGPLLFHAPSRLKDIRQTSSVMYEEDIIMGGETNFRNALDHMLIDFSSKIIIVLTGCIPELIGVDTQEIIKEYNQKQIIFLSAAGFQGSAKDGMVHATTKLIGYMKEQTVLPYSINLIGFFADDYRVDGDLIAIINMLPDEISVNTVFPYDSWENIQKVPAAALNVILEGFDFIGEKLKEQFNMPYVTVRYPYGIEGSLHFIKNICENLHIKISQMFLDQQIHFVYKQLEQIEPYILNLKNLPTAILGDSPRIYGIKDFVEQELGMPVVNMIDTSMNDVDENALLGSNITVLFGNSFHKELAKQMNIPFLRLSYPVFDKISITKQGYSGIRGMVCLIEELVNTIFFQ